MTSLQEITDLTEAMETWLDSEPVVPCKSSHLVSSPPDYRRRPDGTTCLKEASWRMVLPCNHSLLVCEARRWHLEYRTVEVQCRACNHIALSAGIVWSKL